MGFIHPVRWHPPDDGRQCMVVAMAEQLATQVGLPIQEASLGCSCRRLLHHHYSQVGLPIQEASLGCPRHHPSPASPPTSHPSPTSPLQAACSSCGVLSTTTTRRSLRTFSPRQSILKPEWRLWWPFRWQGILRGQVSDEATRDLPKFVTFLEKRVKVFCAHYLLYISISINILLLMFG